MNLKAQLELLCNIIDDVLSAAGLAARVAGGYVAGNGILFSLTDNTFVDSPLRQQLQERLGVTAVVATVGVILVRDWMRGVAPSNTIDVLQLIDLHHTEAVACRR